MKRLLDVVASLGGLFFLCPVLWIFMVLVWLEDFQSPLYSAPRVGLQGRTFRMVKLRSMILGADKTGVDSTSGSDPRITRVGRLIRRYKLDEFSQLWNVLRGDMSLVGPRPNVPREVELYTDAERRLLDVKPGITDLSSIVFSDEGEILAGRMDPDLAYHQMIRPWKSRLGLLYVEKASIFLDLEIILITLMALWSREKALHRLQPVLARLGADRRLRRVSLRLEALLPFPPPGADRIVTSR